MQYDTLYDLLEAFPDEQSCITHLEQLRWPDGPECAWEGCDSKRIYRIQTRRIFKCGECRKQFSVRKGTVFEESRLPLRKWFMTIWLWMDNPKGIAALRLAEMIGVSRNTAWYMLQRLRTVAAAMNNTVFDDGYPVEVDETFLGGKLNRMHAKKRKALQDNPMQNKMTVIGFKHRKTGKVRFEDIPDTNFDHMEMAVKQAVRFPSPLFTDGAPAYRKMGYKQFYVNHSSGEYVRGIVHTNGIESMWAILKRSYKGVYHKMSRKHLWRYLAEFEARWNMRDLPAGRKLDRVLAGTVGVRLRWKVLVA